MNGERCDFCETGTLMGKRVREIYRKGKDFIIVDEFLPSLVVIVANDIIWRKSANG